MKRGKKRRRPFDDETSSVAIGPLAFDLAMARDHGWTEASMERFWLRVERMERRFASAAQRRHPLRFVDVGGLVTFCGEDRAERRRLLAAARRHRARWEGK